MPHTYRQIGTSTVLLVVALLAILLSSTPVATASRLPEDTADSAGPASHVQVQSPAAAAESPAQAPAYGARLFKSGPIQITADGRYVWVANAYADSVSRVDTRDFSVATYNLPDPAARDVPRGIAVTEDGSEVWVAAQEADKVYVLSGADGHLVTTIGLPWGSGPYSVALSRPKAAGGRQSWALVTLHRSGALAAINTATYEPTILAPVFHEPFGIAWTEDGKRALITHLFPDDEHPHFTVVDISTGTPSVVTHLNAFAATPRHTGQLTDAVAEHNLAEGGYLNWRGHPAEIPSSTGKRQVWIPTQYHNMTQDSFTPDSTIQVSLRRFDLDTQRILGNEKIVFTAVQVHDTATGDNNPAWKGYGWDAHMSGAVDLGFTTLGDRLYGALLGEQSNDVVVFPWDTPQVRSTTDAHAPKLPEVPVGDRPMGLAASPTQPLLFVYNAFSFDLSVVDVSDPSHPAAVRRIGLAGPVKEDLLADPVLLKGAKLFFTSADPRISANDKIACASCHVNGEADGRSWRFDKLPAGSAGQGHGQRSTHSLLGVGLTFTQGERDPVTGFGELHHSGDRDEVQDFEYTFQGVQLGGRGFLGTLVQPELGPPNAGRDADLDALAAYVVKVPPIRRSPAREADGRLSESAIRGATFFVGTDAQKPADAQCATCHVPETGFVDHGFHDVGQRRDANEKELNDSAKRGKCLWCVNTDTLIGVWDTSPYDGVASYASDIMDVLMDFRTPNRAASHGRAGGLTVRQVEDLANFVRSIDGNTTATEVRTARDTSPPRIVRVSPTSLSRVEVWFNEAVDAATAGDRRNYRITNVTTGADVPVTDALWDGQNGDRVTLMAALSATPGKSTYRVQPLGGILDLAGTASGGVANAIDPADAGNQYTFTLGDTLTITLGGSGYENITIPVHDASPIGPNLSTWANDRVQAVSGPDPLVPGFVRFGWEPLFTAATGVSDASALLGATFALRAEYGDGRKVEIRRVLQSWRDPDGINDYNQNPVGAPTWRDHAHPNAPWNKPGAAALGGSGADPSDYNGAYDLAEVVDAALDVPSINGMVPFAGDKVTQAFRFWFTHPALDYGYAVRVLSTRPSQEVVSFSRFEAELQRHGPVLTLTYRLPDGSSAPTPEASPTERATERPGPTTTPRATERPGPTATRRATERPGPTATRRATAAWEVRGRVRLPWVRAR